MKSSLRPARLLALACLLLVAQAGITVVAPAAAYAQSSVDARLETMLGQATEDYDVLMIEDAQQKLEEAVELAERKGVESPVVARLHVMLGVVLFAATRDERAAREQFVSALEIDRDAQIDPVYQTPTLNEIMAAARKEVGPAKGEPEEPVAEQPRPAVDGLTHTPIPTAKAGEALPIEVTVPADMPIYRMYVYVRRFGEEGWKRAEMEPVGDTSFLIELPGSEIRTSQIDYYIEAEDRGGVIIAGSGDKLNPHNLVVLGSTDVADGGGTPGDGIDLKGKVDVSGPPSASHAYVMLLGGTDVGFLAGGSPTANPTRDVTPGLAPAFGHALLDAGWTINDSAHLGVYFRMQFAPAQNFDVLPEASVDPGNGFWDTKEECLGLGLPADCLLGLRYKWFFSNSDSMRLYSSFGSGVGRVRNWLKLKQPARDSNGALQDVCSTKEIMADPNGREYCYIRDTVRTGWLHFGLGGGIGFPLTDYMDFVVDTYLMVLVPDTSVNLDLAGGLNVRF